MRDLGYYVLTHGADRAEQKVETTKMYNLVVDYDAGYSWYFFLSIQKNGQQLVEVARAL
jgi:hypothetical protein